MALKMPNELFRDARSMGKKLAESFKGITAFNFLQKKQGQQGSMTKQ